MSNILATQALQIAGMGYKVDLIIVSFVDEEAGENGILAVSYTHLTLPTNREV